MGKRLVIKGADFSNVACAQESIDYKYTWYVEGSGVSGAAVVGNPSAGWCVVGNYAELQGKTINAIRLKVAVSGIITIAVLSGVSASVSTIEYRQVDFSDIPVGTIATKTFASMEVGSTQAVGVINSTDTGKLYYYSGVSSANGFYARVGQGSTPSLLSGYELGVDIGYAEEN